MASALQLTANRVNAGNSTGPRTGDGKSRSSRNATTHGLFAAGDLVRPEEREEYNQLRDGFYADLAPVGSLELLWCREIVTAAWRLRRCSLVEASLLDTAGETDAALTQASIDRARSQSHSLLLRASAELRRLQTERHYRNESLPKGTDPSTFGLASFKEIRRQITPPAAETKRTQFDAPIPAATPRSAPCPCGSGQKFKRCCGRLAPAVLSSSSSVS